MANITLTIDDSWDAELDAAFLTFFANPDSLTGRQLAEKHCLNFLLDCVNRDRVQSAVDSAEASVTKATDLATVK